MSRLDANVEISKTPEAVFAKEDMMTAEANKATTRRIVEEIQNPW